MTKYARSRRKFLQQCALFTAYGAASSYSGIGSMVLPAMAANRPTGYRALVSLYQTGGNDLNMLVPNSDEGYQGYQSVRSNMAINRDQLLPITSGQGATQKQFGLHPELVGVKRLYDSGKLAFIANVGALKQPTTRASFEARDNLPPKLFSHITQKDFVRAGLPFEGERMTGWAGRVADFFNDDSGGRAPLGISFSGNNLWQRGINATPYSFVGSGVRRTFHYDAGSNRRAAFDRINQLDYQHMFAQQFADTMRNSMSLSDFMREGAGAREIELTTSFASDKVSQQLRNVANLINARNGLEMRQQIFYVNIAGYDQHQNLLSRHQTSMRELSAALESFNTALEEMGLAEQVLTFTNCDFGRTLGSNGSGSDHAWGGNHLVMGGGITGKRVYGRYPDFTLDDPQYLDGRGVLVPEIAQDQMSASFARWFGGFTDSELLDLFPNLANFNELDLDLFT